MATPRKPKAKLAPVASPASDLVNDIALCKHDPLRYALYSFPWGQKDLINSDGPRVWQRKVMQAIQFHLSGEATRFQPLRLAVSSGHGIGKSALVSMLISWSLSTLPGTRVLLTANTEPQLRTKTWPEILKWNQLAINESWFERGATSVRVKDATGGMTWRADMVSWSENNTEAFQGLHNQGKRLLVIFDEASAISDRIWEVTEGALTDKDTEIIWIAFGNPTVNTGRFRQCFGSQAHRWQTWQIDSRTVEHTNKTQINQWIQDYGEDSDFVRVRVRGEFPRASSSQFIPSDIVSASRRLSVARFDGLPKILGIDVARFGDDRTVILFRHGRHVETLLKARGLDTVEVAEKVIEAIRSKNPDAVIVDGDGLGAGVVDYLKKFGYEHNLYEFHGASRPLNIDKYANRRSEIWGLMKDSLNDGLSIPDDPEFEADLTGLQYGYNAKMQIQLEKKSDMKRRGLASPDFGDALALTYAVSVNTKRIQTVDTDDYFTHAQGWMA